MKQILLKIAVAVFSALLSFLSANAQNDENTLLWKIDGNGLEKPSYLFGTIHLLCKEDLNVSDKVKNAITNTNQLVLELDLDDPNVLSEVQQKMMFTDGTTAESYLSKEEYKLVSDFFSDSLHIPFDRVKHVKPFFLSSMTTSHFLGCQPTGWEFTLMQKAKSEGKEVIGLESANDQMSIIENLPLEMRKDMLVETIRDYDDTHKLFAEMLSHYLNERVLELHNLTREYMSDDYAQFEEELINKRNKNWIADIQKMAAETPSFFAVGAAHLGGENGVVNELRKKGFDVQPVL